MWPKKKKKICAFYGEDILNNQINMSKVDWKVSYLTMLKNQLRLIMIK